MLKTKTVAVIMHLTVLKFKEVYQMKIAVVSTNGQDVDLHLGKGYSLYVYEYENDDLTFTEHREVDIDLESQHQGSKVIKACEDCDVIIAAQYGFKSKVKADQLNIKLVMDEGSVDEVLKRYIDHYNFMKN